MTPDTLALQRRRQAAHRLEPHPCGCRDPWSCAHRRTERLTDTELDAWEATCGHLADHDLVPVVPAAVRLQMRQRAARRRLLELASA